VAGQDTNVLVNGLEANEEVVSFLVQNNPAAQMSGFVEHVRPEPSQYNTLTTPKRNFKKKLFFWHCADEHLCRARADVARLQNAKILVSPPKNAIVGTV
jgi:hypothetical protein